MAIENACKRFAQWHLADVWATILNRGIFFLLLMSFPPQLTTHIRINFDLFDGNAHEHASNLNESTSKSKRFNLNDFASFYGIHRLFCIFATVSIGKCHGNVSWIHWTLARKRLIRHLVIFSPSFVVYLPLCGHFHCEKISLFCPIATYPFDKPEWVTQFRSLTSTAQIWRKSNYIFDC